MSVHPITIIVFAILLNRFARTTREQDRTTSELEAARSAELEGALSPPRT